MIWFRESVCGFSFLNKPTWYFEFKSNWYKQIIKGSRQFFWHKKRKDKRYLSVNGFLTEKEETLKKKRKINQKSPLGFKLPMSRLASQRFGLMLLCTRSCIIFALPERVSNVLVGLLTLRLSSFRLVFFCNFLFLLNCVPLSLMFYSVLLLEDW